MADDILDKAREVRVGEEITNKPFIDYLNEKLADYPGDIEILQFPGGYSNLTYLIKKGSSEFVLRKPPHGARIKSAHDMGREYKVLSLLKPIYAKVPAPICIHEDNDLLGAPFYLMERVTGLILRNKIPEGLSLTPDSFRKLSINTINNLANLHRLDIEATGLNVLGKPNGYVERQVDGWIKRYFVAETDDIVAMNETAVWMQDNIEPENAPALIHNDYKYDNLILDPDTLEIKALLDWEMATVGDPLMDLGTSLGYWAEQGDHPALKSFGLTGHEGNLNRQEVVEHYTETSGIKTTNIVFYSIGILYSCLSIVLLLWGILGELIYSTGDLKMKHFAQIKQNTSKNAKIK